MTERRFLIVLLCACGALVGVGLVLVSLVCLPEPFVVSGELGRRVDVTRQLVALLVAGLVLLITGVTVVVVLVRGQLRTLD